MDFERCFGCPGGEYVNHESPFRYIERDIIPESYHGLCRQVETYVAWQAFATKAGAPVGNQKKTTIRVGDIAFEAVQIVKLPSFLVIAGPEEMRDMLVLPMDSTLYCRVLAMDTLPASLQKTRMYAQQHQSEPIALMVQEVEEYMQRLSLLFDDVTNALVQEILT